MLEKQIAVDQIEVVGEYSFVQVRTTTKIVDNGVEIAKTYHRHVVQPGDDYANEDTRVAAVCAALHTPELVAAFREKLASETLIAQEQA
jgi:hypothetical protein